MDKTLGTSKDLAGLSTWPKSTGIKSSLDPSPCTSDAVNVPVNGTHIEASLMAKLHSFIRPDTPPSPQVFDALLAKTHHQPEDLTWLLGPLKPDQLEALARKANRLTQAHFGRTISLFTPLYLANYCDNRCIYCAFNQAYEAKREKLGPEDIDEACRRIKDQGLDEVLLLTGESRKHSGLDYLIEAADLASKHFNSVGIEVYPLETEAYKALHQKGVSSLTIYQETYDPLTYDKLHLKGPKKDFSYRLATPERGALGGLNKINIGALLGLRDPYQDAYMTLCHLWLLLSKYPSVEWGLSLPRIKAIENGTFDHIAVSDQAYVQILIAYRLMFPTSPISVSTRESANLRRHLLPLGVTKLSAGVSTSVGRKDQDQATPQFTISDPSSINQVKAMVKEAGYQTIIRNWVTHAEPL